MILYAKIVGLCSHLTRRRGVVILLKLNTETIMLRPRYYLNWFPLRNYWNIFSVRPAKTRHSSESNVSDVGRRKAGAKSSLGLSLSIWWKVRNKFLSFELNGVNAWAMNVESLLLADFKLNCSLQWKRHAQTIFKTENCCFKVCFLYGLRRALVITLVARSYQCANKT